MTVAIPTKNHLTDESKVKRYLKMMVSVTFLLNRLMHKRRLCIDYSASTEATNKKTIKKERKVERESESKGN